MAFAEDASSPWRLAEALKLPEWLRMSGEHRIRYETLDGQFRAGGDGGDQVLALRTNLRLEAHTEHLALFSEVLDARQYLADSGSTLDSTLVNAVDLLQGYAQWRGDFGTWGRHQVRIGRETLDLGNRRLMARNAYRNTINAFTGAHWLWQIDKGPSIRAFWFLPVTRLPDDQVSLLDNDIAWDEESTDLQFWGVYAEIPLPLPRLSLEVYTFGLHEFGETTRERQLYSPGFRLNRKPAPGAVDFEWESVLQVGDSRTSALAGAPVLEHRAHFHHIGVGYTFEMPWTPNVRFSYDYASGDSDPDDDRNYRFDTLFGARRFEFGPTNLYGAISRSNLNSPEIRITVKPTKRMEYSIAHRGIWLASKTDTWTPAGVRDRSGQSGRHVGQQLEVRARLEIIPDNVRLDLGLARIFKGSFQDDAPNGRGVDTTYGYCELTLLF